MSCAASHCSIQISWNSPISVPFYWKQDVGGTGGRRGVAQPAAAPFVRMRFWFQGHDEVHEEETMTD